MKRVRKPNVQAGLDAEGADSEEALEEFRVEVELMKSLDHPSICRLLQVYEDPKNLRLGNRMKQIHKGYNRDDLWHDVTSYTSWFTNV